MKLRKYFFRIIIFFLSFIVIYNSFSYAEENNISSTPLGVSVEEVIKYVKEKFKVSSNEEITNERIDAAIAEFLKEKYNIEIVQNTPHNNEFDVKAKIILTHNSNFDAPNKISDDVPAFDISIDTGNGNYLTIKDDNGDSSYSIKELKDKFKITDEVVNYIKDGMSSGENIYYTINIRLSGLSAFENYNEGDLYYYFGIRNFIWNPNDIEETEDNTSNNPQSNENTESQVGEPDSTPNEDMEQRDKEVRTEEEDSFFDKKRKVEDAIDSAKKVLDSISGLSEDFGKNIAGTLINLISNFLRTVFGDVPQILANMIQNIPDGRNVLKISYSYNDLIKEEEKYIELNKYTKVSEGEVNSSKKDLTISNYNEERKENRGFSKKTKIPVIPAEMYNMAAGNIDMMDVNIFDVNKEVHGSKGDKLSPWYMIRNIGRFLIRISIYVVTAFLLTILILNGIKLTSKTLTPDAKVKCKNELEHFAVSLVMLVGTVLIMTLIIYSNEMIMEIVGLKIEDGNRLEQPIRVTVIDETKQPIYSFSTSLTGYLRYMTENKNVNLYGEKAFYTLLYIVFAICNLLATIYMLFRMFIMILLGIVGPVIVGFYAIGKQEKAPLKFNSWVILYALLAMVQPVIAIIYGIILKCVFI